MKSFFLFFLVILSFQVFAQTWPRQGAEWHYRFAFLSGYGFTKIVFEKDTIIGNRSCAKFSGISYYYGFTGPDRKTGLIRTEKTRVQFTYQSGDTVFYRTGDQFKILYCFKAKVGDIWELNDQSTGIECHDASVKVDSVGTIAINSSTLRWVSVSPTENSNLELRGRIAERIGAIDGYLFPVIRCCYPWVCDLEDFHFACYQDNQFPLYNVTGVDCEYYLKTNIQSTELSPTLYPIPATDKVYYSGSISSAIILTLDGKTVCEPEISGNQIDLSGMDSGVYIVIIKDKYGKTVSQKMIKQ